jgi:Rod binding domain-containing protein
MLSHPPAITAGSPDYAAALKKEAKKLEGVFLNTLTSAMFSSIKTDGEFGGGFGEQTWRSMQAEQLADQISQSGGIGLADSITRSLLDVQAAASIHPKVNVQGAYPQ